MANRSGHLDSLVVVAALPGTILISEPAILTTLPLGMTFLLEPLVAPPVDGEVAPPGGTLKDRVQQGLVDGHLMLVFADNPTDTAPAESRFRIEPIQAAVEVGLPLKPVLISSDQQAVNQTNGVSGQNTTSVTVGQEVNLDSASPNELTKLRDRVREALGELGG